MNEQHSNNSGLVKDIIIGMSDGLTVPFALTAGLSGVLNTNHLIIVSGMAEIAAGCISMGLGGFLAGESEIDHYNAELKREYSEIETVPKIELKEVEDALISMGVDTELSEQVALQISKNKDQWANFMMQTELKLEKPVENRARKSATTIAGEIKKLGMRPGLWTRPLCAKHNDPPKLLAPSITNRNDVNMPILDPTIEENIERIKNMIITYKQWNYDLVKHDFTTYDIFGRWGFEMNDALTVSGWQFNDNTKTNAEIILHLYASIREAAGDMYLIGCNTMSHLSAGLFELNRIGDDTSGKEWVRTRKMGVNTLGFRMVQHKTFYEADGDCVGLTNEVPWSKNKQWMQLLAQSSTPLFISAQPDALGAEQKQFIKQSFHNAACPQPVAEPLDWLNNPLPATWKLDGKVVKFDWS